VISKAGVCSRSQTIAAIQQGRVSVNGCTCLEPEHPVDSAHDAIVIDGEKLRVAERVDIAVNKPRGIVISADDERGRDTIYDLLASARFPWIAPVGRLDRASECLLLMSNDSEWAAGITDPVQELHWLVWLIANATGMNAPCYVARYRLSYPQDRSAQEVRSFDRRNA
jgi:23S rRNA pseudouridine2605 synthase